MPKPQEQTFETNLHRKAMDWQIYLRFAVRLSLSKTDSIKKSLRYLGGFKFSIQEPI